MNLSILSFAAAIGGPACIAWGIGWLVRPRLRVYISAAVFILGGILSFALAMFLFVPFFFRPFAEFVLESDSSVLVGVCEALFSAAIPEELALFIVVLLCCWCTRSLPSPAACVQISASVALGFAAVENAFWSLTGAGSNDSFQRLMPTLSFAFSGIIVGWLISKVSTAEKRRWMSTCGIVFVPITLHFLYDVGILIEIDIPGLEELPDDELPPDEMIKPLVAALGLMALSCGVLLIEFVWALAIVRRLRRQAREPREQAK